MILKFQNISSNKQIHIYLIVFVALLLRIFVGLGDYHNQNQPPKFGDFEAQRHWLELTFHTPPQEWYIETIYNNLSYWPLDYPPLTAYHSRLFGYLSHIYEPDSVALVKSHGYETKNHKIFMRMTVLLSDAFIYISSVVALVLQIFKKCEQHVMNSILFFILILPPFIIIDHGHFQYNCCLIGFVQWAIYFCIQNKILLGSFFFTLAINFKIMGLYYSLAFFAFILSILLFDYGFTNKSATKVKQFIIYYIMPTQVRIRKFLIKLFFTGSVVILTFLFLWIPWLSDKQLFQSVVQAIFPIRRGLFQHQIATFCCMTNVIADWHNNFNPQTLSLFCSLLTLIFSLPSFAIILRSKKNKKQFLIGIFLITMSFFFFSYHVHEKTILIPFSILPFLIKFFNYYVVDFSMVASFTMYQLLKESNQTINYFILQIFTFIIGNSLVKSLINNKIIDEYIYINKQNNHWSLKYLYKLDIYYKEKLRAKIYRYFISDYYANMHLYFPFAATGFIFYSYIYLRASLLMIANLKILDSKKEIKAY